MTLDEIKKEIEKANNIVILTHEAPDGDAIGSILAMKLGLKQMGKEADLIIEECPKTYAFLPGTEDIKTSSKIEKYDLAISLDCADEKRLNGGLTYFENAKVKVVIDHHGSNKMFGDLNFVNPASPACCEILIAIFEYCGVEITKEMGECLLTGIITDTGGFKYDGVTAETFEFTAELLRKGVHVSEIYKRVLQVKTRAHFELSKLVMERMELLENDKIAFSYLTLEDLEKTNAEPGDDEGLVEIGRDIEGIEVSVFIKEKEGENGYKVSLRSSNDINVSDICLLFGGGGHPKAAGCFIQGDIEQVKNKLINAIRKAF